MLAFLTGTHWSSCPACCCLLFLTLAHSTQRHSREPTFNACTPHAMPCPFEYESMSGSPRWQPCRVLDW